MTVETEFAAAHALRVRGELEPLHGHNWHVTVTVAAPTLDADGLVCDFHAVQRALADAVDRLSNRNLNEVPPFDRVNPSAEHVARHLAERVAAAVDRPSGPRVRSVRVTEAPGCSATYHTPDGRDRTP